MIIPSIDLQRGSAVQLVGGVTRVLEAGDPEPIARRFARVGDLAVVDLDAAMGVGNNASAIQSLVASHACRVGGGVRTAAQAIAWLDAGAVQVVLGTAAVPEVLRALPKHRVIAALDAIDDDVVIDGWRTRTGRSVAERMVELRDLVGGFLVTFVEREGRLGGTALERVPALIAAAGDARVTIAGGITTAAEVAELDRMGADAQIGMALYTGALSLADAFAAPLSSDRPDGLWPTAVCDESGVLLGLAWSDRDSLTQAIDEGIGVYRSRQRGIWVKGATSGNDQRLIRASLDCDRDVVRFTVCQHGTGFCHRGTGTCFGAERGMSALLRTIDDRTRRAPAGSYTRRLLDDPALLHSKLVEEARELAEATGDHAVRETADLLYFALVALARKGGSWSAVEVELDRRSRLVSRRPGATKVMP